MIKKKITTKKPASRTVKKARGAKKRMPKAQGAYCFWVNFGPILSDLRELEGALETMTDEQFKYHVNGRRNDFASWVKDVLGEKPLATKLRKCGTRGSACKAVAVYIKQTHYE